MKSIQGEASSRNPLDSFGKQLCVLAHDAGAHKKLDRPAVILFCQHHPFMRAQIAGHLFERRFQNYPPFVLHAPIICGEVGHFLSM